MTTNLSFLSQHSRGDNFPASPTTAPTTPPRPVARMPMSSSPTGSFETGHSFVIVTPTTKLPCFFVDGHPRNPVFVGRGEELEKLDDYLLADPQPRPRVNNTTKRACAIWGVGGVGKTQIAVEWAYSRKSEFQAVLWANAQSREQLDISFSQIAEKLGLLTQANSLSPRTVVREVKEWLADPLMSTPSSSQGVDTASAVKPARASWLLIFDSVGDLDDLHSYWPEGDEGSILVTCRDPKIEENPSFACNSIELDPFSQDDALDFFKKSLGGLIRKTPSDSEEATTVALQYLADRLHYFPLYMTAVAGAMKRLGITAQEYLTYYQSEIGSAKLFASEVPEYGHRSMALSWDLESLSEGAAALLNVASLLSTTGISEDILRQKPEGALAIDFPQDAVSYFEDLAVLSQSSFAIRNIPEKSIFVHDIVQDVTRAMLVSTAGKMERTFEATVKLVSAVWPFVTVAPQPVFAEYRQNKRWNQCERIYPHLLSLSNVFERYSLLQAPSLEVYDFTLLLSEMAWYQLERADPTSCQAAADLALKIVEERGLPEREAFRAIVSAVHGTLQQLAFDTNDPKSCFFHAQQALTIQEDLCAQSGRRTQKLAVALSEMGKACSRNKLYHKALDCYEESRRIREAQPGFKPAALYTYHLGRGHALWLLGKHDEASSSIEQALQLQVETYGVVDDTTSHRTGLALFALGNIRLSQGRLLESHSLHQRALRQFKVSVGVNHMYYAAACYKDGEHNMRFNEYEFSKLRFETALRVYCDDKHYRQEIARTKFQLGKALLCLGETGRGGELMKDARKLYGELVPDNSCAPNELNDADFDDLICFWFR